MAAVLSLDVGSPASSGVASGWARAILRLEGAAAFAISAALYTHAGFYWPLFAVLFLAPDVAMLGYLMGVRIGAGTYNIAHTTARSATASIIRSASATPISAESAARVVIARSEATPLPFISWIASPSLRSGSR